MSDEKVVAYIKSQVAKGFSREKIREVLLAQGWDKAIVANSFKEAIPDTNKKQKKKKTKRQFSISPKILLLSSIIFPIILVGGVVFFFINRNQEEVIETEPATTIDCISNMTCFIQAAQECVPAKLMHTVSLDIFLSGVTQTTATYFEIKGFEENLCVLYFRTESIELSFPTDVSEEIVAQQEELYDALEGREATCSMGILSLGSLLKSWNEGTFNTNDLSESQCEGNFFSQSF